MNPCVIEEEERKKAKIVNGLTKEMKFKFIRCKIFEENENTKMKCGEHGLFVS